MCNIYHPLKEECTIFESSFVLVSGTKKGDRFETKCLLFLYRLCMYCIFDIH